MHAMRGAWFISSKVGLTTKSARLTSIGSTLCGKQHQNTVLSQFNQTKFDYSVRTYVRSMFGGRERRSNWLINWNKQASPFSLCLWTTYELWLFQFASSSNCITHE
jgi:hypothetical protein